MVKNSQKNSVENKIEIARNRQKSSAKEEGKYVYCIIKGSGKALSFGICGIEPNSKIYTIPYKDILAVVSDTDKTNYLLTEDNIRMHNKVTEFVMERHPVIPMAFGMAFKNKEILFSVLEKSYDAIKKSLALFDGKIELGVKIVMSKDMMELLDTERKTQISSHIFESLKGKSAESVNNKLFSERLLLNASFLVEKDKVEHFSEEVDKLKDMLTPKIQYTGPWPPYNFVKIKIGNGE